MHSRSKAENHFVTQIKNNTVYYVVKKLDLPDNTVKDEIIRLSSHKAQQTGIDEYELRLVKLQLISRTIANKTQAFSNFVGKIRICLSFYLSIDYICNHIRQGTRKIKALKQAELIPE